MRPSHKLLLLGVGALGLIALFLTIDVRDWAFTLPFRGRKIIAIAIVAFAISYATVVFQTVTNNRILTPSIIGFDMLYILLQTGIVYLFGSATLAMMDSNALFLVNAGTMVVFATLLYRWLFGREGRNLYFLVLVGVVFGTLFGSMTSFMQMLIAPNDFVILQDRMFASFNSVNSDLLGVSSALLIGTFAFSLRYTRNLDVLSLGREHAINLGVDHKRVVSRLMIVIAVMVAISTALVGPITFFGLLVANLSYQMMRTYRHSYLIPAAALISLIVLVGGQLVVERVFSFTTSISVIVNFAGGIYFIALLLREVDQ